MEDSTNTPSQEEVTALLEQVDAGDQDAAERLLPILYSQLRQIAGSLFVKERTDHTLQATALVHEAYIKLVRGENQEWKDREHFCAVAAKAMRQILCDHARAKKTAKRDPGGSRKPLTMIGSPSDESAIDVLVLDECLGLLAEADPQGATVVDLRFFGGLAHTEIAQVLDVSVSTVDRAWRRARAWIKANLEEHTGEDTDT